VTRDDVRIERVDLTAYRSAVLTADEDPTGKIATRAFMPGEALRHELLRAPAIVRPGDAVKVVLTGSRFSIVTDGRSLSTAGEGEVVKFAVAGGQTVTGLARPGKVVELR
jgi:flagella basal body P-ring formation protein FlgA